AIFILKQIVDRGRRMHVQNLRGFDYIQYPFFVLHAQAVFGPAANVQQDESARHAACLGRAKLGLCQRRRQPPRRRQGADRTRALHEIPAILLHGRISFNSLIFSMPGGWTQLDYKAIRSGATEPYCKSLTFFLNAASSGGGSSA